MNTTNNYNGNNTSLESLRYDSLFSNQEFKIDSENNLHITELSTLKRRNEIIPIDLINPEPISKKRLKKSLLLLGLASALVSSIFFAVAIFMSQLWTISFAIVFMIFGMGTLIASYKNSTSVYQYKFINTETILFSLSEPSSQGQQVGFFIKALNNRISRLNGKSELSETGFNDEGLKQLGVIDEEEVYRQEKQSQYIRHLDFLFNHGIVDEVLYKRLNKKINKKIDDSENRFMTAEPDSFENQILPNNIINFPVNA
jgi:hypothetical protein